MIIGPKSREQLTRLSTEWKQGDHVLVSGGTNSGKTTLARYLDEVRLKAGGSVVVFVSKLRPDATITNDYKGWTRWTSWWKNPSLTENRILLWPKVEHKNHREAVQIMRYEYAKAFDEISKTGRWTVHLDEGLFICSPEFLGLSGMVGLMYQMMRSSKGTMITLAQRPSHLPVAIYPNLSQAFIGQASELPDLRRLANLDGRTNSRELQNRITRNGRHDFTWLGIGQDREPETINLKF